MLQRLCSIVLLCAAGALGLAGCATQVSENFYAVRDGMTKAEVEHLLGQPSSTWPGEEGTEIWQYGDSLSSLATTGLFREPDTSRTWVVWFDGEGKVSSFSEPEWKRNR